MLLRLRRCLQRRPKHQHDLMYHPRSITGWGVVRCLGCGLIDLY